MQKSTKPLNNQSRPISIVAKTLDGEILKVIPCQEEPEDKLLIEIAEALGASCIEVVYGAISAQERLVN